MTVNLAANAMGPGGRVRRLALAIYMALGVLSMVASTSSSAETLSRSLDRTEVGAQQKGLAYYAGLTRRFGSPKSAQKAAEKSARLMLVSDAALTLGVHGGYRERAMELHRLIEDSASTLDAVYGFGALIERGRLLVPSVEFSERASEVERDGSQLRETARVLRVREPARLVTAPPTWRDYFHFRNLDLEVELPDDTLLPQSSDERTVWETNIALGWLTGREQAEGVFAADLETLTQSYIGRLRYRMLVAQQILAPAEIGHTDFGVVQEADVLRIEDQLFAVKEAARFLPASGWKPIVTRSEQTGRGAEATPPPRPVVRRSESP